MGREIRRVNRPVFRISKPGEDVHWTTREQGPSSPQLEAIKRKRQQVMEQDLMDRQELQNSQDFAAEDPEAYNRMIMEPGFDREGLKLEAGSFGETPEELDYARDILGAHYSKRELDLILEKMKSRK